MQLLRLFVMRRLSYVLSTCSSHAFAIVSSQALQRAFRAFFSHHFYFSLTLRKSTFQLRGNLSAPLSEAHQYQSGIVVLVKFCKSEWVRLDL
jgi:hypothetical protein